MCRRYLLELDQSELGIKIKEKILSMSLNNLKMGEICPEDQALVLIYKDHKLKLTLKKWGIESKSLIINARNENIADKVTFKPMLENRCLVIAKGFYEWKTNQYRQQKVYIQKKDHTLMFLAGIYNDKNEMVIITQNSQREMKKVHHRSPVIFSESEIMSYLTHQTAFTNIQPEFEYHLCEE